MHHFEYRRGHLHAEDVPLSRIAHEVGTPAYVYSRATLTRHYRVMDEALKGREHLVCFAVKACPNVGVLDLLARQGAGFDIVSGGELHRVIAAGGDPGKVVFSGVGKTEEEMAQALEAGVRLFNVESEAELEHLERVAARMDRTAPVSIRVNPDVDPKTHPYIATGLKDHKFGVPLERARALYARAAELPHLQVRGVSCHIGSQLTDLSPILDAVARMKALLLELRAQGHPIDHLDLGGGLGIEYEAEEPPRPDEWGTAVREALADVPDLTVVVEPGRVIAGNAGILLTRVLYVKPGEEKDFVVVDAAMNDLARPALYGAFHRIRPVDEAGAGTGAADPGGEAEGRPADVVGPVCESGDFLARDRRLPPVKEGDLLAVMSAGAYGFSMASNYNSRPRAAEVVADGEDLHVVRRRETLEELTRSEARLPADT